MTDKTTEQKHMVTSAEFTPSMKRLQNLISNRLGDLIEIHPDRAHFVAACIVSTIQRHSPEYIAAPELLEASEWTAKGEHHSACIHHSRKSSVNACNCYVGAAKAAIAKASKTN